jgi:hypothetical protein
MAVVSEMPTVDKKWHLTKYWCDLFFTPHFFEGIRKQHSISMQSEDEILNAYSAEMGKPRADQVICPIADTFDFSKIAVEKVVDQYEPLLEK